jgi:hypothetical protein
MAEVVFVAASRHARPKFDTNLAILILRRMLVRSLSRVVAVSLFALVATGCPKGLPGMGGKSKVDPNTCGNYAVSVAGRKLQGFLEATARLDTTMQNTVAVVRESCAIMGRELGMPSGQLEGETRDVCARVIKQIDDNMKVSIKADASLKVDYKPAVCTVDVDAMASAAAECEAKASADMRVTCDGHCSGTCNGSCDGTCNGTAGTGGSSGQCNGECSGTCGGSCTGGCDGSADVDASAQCKAEAEVKASVDVRCTEPEYRIEADAGAMIDTSTAERTLRALQSGMPKMLSIQARLRPLQRAVASWAYAAGELGDASADLAQSFGDQALCISGQIAAAVGMVTNIKASVSVSVEVSASASASARTN